MCCSIFGTARSQNVAIFLRFVAMFVLIVAKVNVASAPKRRVGKCARFVAKVLAHQFVDKRQSIPIVRIKQTLLHFWNCEKDCVDVSIKVVVHRNNWSKVCRFPTHRRSRRNIMNLFFYLFMKKKKKKRKKMKRD